MLQSLNQGSLINGTPIGSWIESHNNKSKAAAAFIGLSLGVIMLAALAQISIPLPFTPVPITGQTFGVMLVSLLWGRKWGFSTVAAYVGLGALGMPIFAAGAAGLKLASAGYLVGMCVASFVVGSLAERQAEKSFAKCFSLCLVGSLCVFGFGLLVLSQFVPAKMLLVQGLLPFIPGDIIKSSMASFIASRFKK